MKTANNSEKHVLSFNMEIVDKAKAAGINVATISEQLLRSTTYEPKSNTTKDVAKAYETFFDATLPLLVKYNNVNVDVGRNVEGNALITIYPGGPDEDKVVFIAYTPLDEVGQITSGSVEELLSYLYEPKVILHNLILAVSEAAQKNTQTIKELDFALRFVKALAD